MENLETSRLDDRHKALFRFIDKVNRDSPRITPEDMAPLRELGWTDEELYFVITVCALFNFYNRWVDASRRARAVGPGPPGGGQTERRPRLRAEVNQEPVSPV